ncbi:MAG: ferrous iron transporter B, partial [Firmicutes bacterium]|nr:ferrous iron transporter B [Bacillota bacterium]
MRGGLLLRFSDHQAQVWALTGNPNCGKTTLFNRITGSAEMVGNFSGATVRQRAARLKSDRSVCVVDLPGTYSLIPYSPEEEVTRRFVLQEQPDLILNVADATNLERSLYLTTQLQETGRPVVLALNMADELPQIGRTIDFAALSRELKLPVFPVSAANGSGIAELLQGCRSEAARSARQREKRLFTAPAVSSGVMRAAQRRYRRAESICAAVQQERPGSNPRKISDRIDRVLTGPAAIPLFFLLLFAVMSAAFGPISSRLTGMLQQFAVHTLGRGAGSLLAACGASPWMQSLILDGILAGLGGVISFLPQLAVMFTFLEFISDCGYLARVAFAGDRLLQKIGLSGKALVPLLLGFGCTVPAVLSVRTLERPRDKILVLLMLPCFSCSARIPVYSLFLSCFFPELRPLLLFGLYLLGICCAALGGILLQKTVLKDEDAPFIMEMPPYRMPRPQSLVRQVWRHLREFLVKAGSVLLLATAAVWALQYFSPELQPAASPEESLLALAGKAAAPLFAPCGFADWRAAAPLFCGLVSKETIVSALSVVLR